MSTETVTKPLALKAMLFAQTLGWSRDFNATRVAIEVGYSPKSARKTACDLLADPRVKRVVEGIIAQRMDEARDQSPDLASAHRMRLKLQAKHGRKGRAGRREIDLRTRTRIMERDGFRCRRCGAGPDDSRLVVDHIVPVSRGGKSHDGNLQTLCEDCNAGKSNGLPHPHDLRPFRTEGDNAGHVGKNSAGGAA